METNQLIDFCENAEDSGFRLLRFEVFNWGTFHQKVHVLRLDGKTALLTGPNGSGKSTLVDGLLTLLVPRTSGRNYNMASGAAKKTERSERTYIQGVWAEGLAGDSDVVEPKKLRPELGTPSVLLAVFENKAAREWVSIAQVLWMTGEKPEAVYVVANKDCSIVQDFKDLGDPRKIERTLKAREMDVFTSFPSYAETFCKRMHLKYPDALNLINTVVAIKETGEIADFIRRHMLVRFEKADDLIAAADQHLNDLERCKHDIETAELQIEMLKPVNVAHQKLEAAKAAKDEIQYLRDNYKSHLAHIFTKQATARIAEIEGAVKQVDVQASVLMDARAKAEARRDQAIAALAGMPEAAQLNELARQESDLNREINTKKAARFEYDKKLKACGLYETVSTEAQFNAMRNRIESKRKAAKGAYADAIGQIQTHRNEAKQLREEAKAKLEQIKQIENTRSRVRGEAAAMRDAISRETNIPASSLPFAGELIEVRKEHAEWRESLELLLGGFGRSMLIEDRYFKDVMRYLNRNRLNGKLDFNRVPMTAPAVAEVKGSDQGRIFGLLHIRPDHPLRGSVADELRRRFPHKCCATEAEFSSEDYAITKNHLHRSGNRGTKDDRRKTIDPENFVLGWDNQELVQTLSSRARKLTEEAEKAETAASKIEEQVKGAERVVEQLGDLLRIESYEAISLQRAGEELDKVKTARSQILREDSPLAKHTALRNQAVKDVDDALTALTALQVRKSGLEQEQKKVQKVIDSRAELLGGLPENFDQDLFGSRLRQYVKRHPSVTHDVADAVEVEILTGITNDLSKKDSAIRTAQEELGDVMKAFLIRFPNLQSDLASRVDRVGDFLTLMLHLEKERLPEARARFVQLMNDSIQKNIALLDQKLRESVDEYKHVLKGLNASLKEIEYNRREGGGTYIRIAATPTRASGVIQFQRDLKDCLIGATDPSEETINKAFEKIRALLTRLRSDEKWRRFVVDTRNWLDFRADEVTCDLPEQVFPHSSTDSKSGGQKVKLAFTVMAASVAYQFGLLREHSDVRSFRFVMIDEIFGKTDETNSVFALKLFKKFKLQLLLVCPFSAQARVVDGFVSSYHLTSNPNWNDSQLISATLEQIAAARREQLAAS